MGQNQTDNEWIKKLFMEQDWESVHTEKIKHLLKCFLYDKNCPDKF